MDGQNNTPSSQSTAGATQSTTAMSSSSSSAIPVMDAADFLIQSSSAPASGRGQQVDGEPEDEVLFEDVQDDTRQFDEAVGALEEMLIDPSFTSFHTSFLDTHCGVFDASDENKLEYTTIHSSYVRGMEELISRYLKQCFGEEFTMDALLGEVEKRGEEELSEDVFDVLATMADFEAFKALILDHKQKINKQEQSTTGGVDASSMSVQTSSSSSSNQSSSADRTHDRLSQIDLS